MHDFFLLIMVKKFLKLTIQKEKKEYFGFKYSKTAVKNAATPIIAPIVLISFEIFRVFSNVLFHTHKRNITTRVYNRKKEY